MASSALSALNVRQRGQRGSHVTEPAVYAVPTLHWDTVPFMRQTLAIAQGLLRLQGPQTKHSSHAVLV